MVHLSSPFPHVLGGVIASCTSSSVESESSGSLRRTETPVPCLSASRAAAHAHSSVRFARLDIPNSTYSLDGGLKGGAMGDDGIFSHMLAFGLCRLVGVRGTGMRSSEREATRSREGREDVIE
jgi:hypothetical protein